MLMTRKAFVAGNWKLNKNISETKELSSALEAGLGEGAADAAIIPTFTSLAEAKSNISKVALGAQDLSQYESGAYTGEISAEMLLELGVEYVLVGHSERREHFKEDDSIINAKTARALEAGLKVILCCGESLETREAGKTDEWVCGQIKSGLEGIQADASNLTIAYEPIWAIGTGKVCESEEANRVIKVIRAQVAEIYGQEAADQIRILYGGSVKSTTIAEQISQSDIDGALVGGASLKADEFLKIVSLAGNPTAAAC